MLTLPNVITLVRLALVPLLVLLLLQRRYDVALLVFVISASTDLADGFIARRWHQRSRFGAIADPVADKSTMLAVTLLLALQSHLPWWFALAVILRDVVIVGGAAAYHFLIGYVQVAPSAISKVNTALEFLVLASALAIGAGVIDEGTWWRALLLVTLATIVASGVHYVIAWGRKAARSQRSSS